MQTWVFKWYVGLILWHVYYLQMIHHFRTKTAKALPVFNLRLSFVTSSYESFDLI